MYGVIYKITNKINGKFYIGQTKRTLEKRWKEHCHIDEDLVVDRAINKYGSENFDHKVIIKCNSLEELNHRESYCIRLFNSMDRDVGYNRHPGGGNRAITEETKKKLSIINSGEGNGFFGKTHTKETKKIIKEKRANQIFSEDTKTKISIINSGSGNPFHGKKHTKETKDFLSKIVKESDNLKKLRVKVFCPELNISFESITEAANYIKVDTKNIRRILSGERKKTKGLTFIRVEKKDVV